MKIYKKCTEIVNGNILLHVKISCFKFHTKGSIRASATIQGVIDLWLRTVAGTLGVVYNNGNKTFFVIYHQIVFNWSANNK